MKNVPREIKLHILSFLRNKQSLGRVSQVSKEWNELAKQDVLWSPFIYANKIDDAKEKYKKILECSKIKVLYYTCTSDHYSLCKYYKIPPDFKFRDVEKNNHKIGFYTPSAIKYGTHIGPHADIIKTLETASCVVINVAEDGYQHFAHYINKLLTISDIEIPNHQLLGEAPKLTGGFPQIPIIVITKSDFVDVIKKQAKSNNISLYKIIHGKLADSLKDNRNTDEIQNAWLELEKTIMQIVLHKRQKIYKEIVEEKNTRKNCSIQ